MAVKQIPLDWAQAAPVERATDRETHTHDCMDSAWAAQCMAEARYTPQVFPACGCVRRPVELADN